jgi:hypothetical protein
MANSDYKPPVAVRAGHFTPIAETAAALDYLDRSIPLGRTNFPTADSLKIGMACLIDDEFMALTGITPSGITVKRGCADTVPAKHPETSLIWFFDAPLVSTDAKEYSAGETTSVKYSPYTIGGGAYPYQQSPVDEVVFNYRFFRPYPPGALKANADRWWIEHEITTDKPNLKLTWTHRSRIIEADQLVDHDVTNIGPEAGTTYTARIYDSTGLLKATYTDIMKVVYDRYGRLIPPTWTYTWQQAMLDLGFSSGEDAQLVPGVMTFFSTRDGFDSWQGYTLPFKIDTQGKFIKVAQLAEMAAQQPNPIADPGTPPTGLTVGQYAEMVAQNPSPLDDDVVSSAALYVGQLAQGAASETNFYTTMNRNLFESPYAFQMLNGEGPANMLVTVAARPSDRLVDAYDVWTRYDWPAGSGNVLPYNEVAEPKWTPWATLLVAVAQMDTRIDFDKTSAFDGVLLDIVKVGQIAMVDAEMFRVDEIDATGITLARGCYDTVPAKHNKGARIWFYGAMFGHDHTGYPERIVNKVLGGAVQVKMRPSVYGPPLSLLDVPTDRLETKSRSARPYPPGQVMANDKRWFNGAVVQADTPVIISWVHRHRTNQGAAVIDHLAPDQGAESDQQYRLTISITITPKAADAKPYVVTIRQEIVDGTSWTYTYDMAKQDGYRAGSLLGVCGRVTVGLVLEAIRYDLVSWQGYVIPLLLPSYTCPPGQPPGGGQLPATPGNGNGETGGETPGGQTPGGDNTGDGPKDPIDNGGGNNGDNGTGPPKPPELPPDWPDPVDPPPVDPNDPNPNLAAHWDLNWDRHWDAYNKDNTGN